MSTFDEVVDQVLLELAASDSAFTNILDIQAERAKIINDLQSQAYQDAVQAIQDAANAASQAAADAAAQAATDDTAAAFDQAGVGSQMSSMFSNALQNVAQTFQQAFTNGGKAGAKSAADQINVYGIDANLPEPLDYGEYLDHVLSDLQSNFEKAVPGLTDALKSGATDDYQSQVSDLAMRAGAGASVLPVKAASDSFNDNLLAAADQNQDLLFYKVWVTNFGPNTCEECAALNGQVIEVTDQFGADVTFGADAPGVYMNLDGPPRHVNCNCDEAVWVTSQNGMPLSPGYSPKDMQADAYQWASDNPSMAPQTFQSGELSDVATSSQHITADDIRAIPEGKWQQAKDFFMACIYAITGKG